MTLRTSSGRSAISAIPPALSVIGPNASSATIRPVSGELRHHRDADAVDAAELVGAEDAEHQHDRRQRRRLEALREARMMFVAWPVCDAAAVFLTGPKRVDV